MVTINAITVSGLYGFKEESVIKFGNNNLIVGPNNSGKTNIIRLFQFAINAFTFSRLPPVRYNKTERFPTLKLEIQFSEDESEILANFMANSLVHNTAFDKEPINEFPFHFGKLRDFVLELKFADTGTEDIEVSDVWLSEKTSGLQIKRSRSNQVITNEKAKNQPINFTSALEEINRTQGVTIQSMRPDHLIQFFNDRGNPIMLPDIIEPQYPSRKLYFTNMKKKLGYTHRDNISFFYLLSRIMQSKISYLSEQRRIKEQEDMLDATELDESGENLASYLFNLKNNSSKELRKYYSELEKQFPKILNEEVHFNIVYDEKSFRTEDNKERKHVIPKIIFERNGIQFSQDEVGAGIKELLLLLTKSKLEKNSIMLMDEPALHIHPIQLKVALRVGS